MKIISIESFDHISDPSTPDFLLPSSFVFYSNTDEIDHAKLALKKAMEVYLTKEERRLIQLHYWNGESKTEIAKREGVVPSTISKRMKKAEDILADKITFALSIYKAQKEEHRSYYS